MRYITALLFSLFAAVAFADDYVNMSYCTDVIKSSVAIENGAPTKAAIAITRGMLGNYRNAQIVGVRVGLASSATNVSGWLVEGGDYTKSPAVTSPTYSYRSSGWLNLIFREPYEFPEAQGDRATVIVGYTSTGENQIGFDGEPDVYDNGNFMWSGSRGWGSVAKICRENGYGNACIQVLLGGIDLPTADMAVASITTRHAEQGKPFTLRGTVHNRVPTPVTAYTIAYSINGGEPVEQRMVQNVNSGEPADFELELPPFTTVGPQQVAVTITSVNGEADVEPADNTLVAEIQSIEAGCYFPQVHVVEESTNVECGFCPRGIVVMESMAERHPDTFIGIAVHSDVTSQADPYYVPSYYYDSGLYRYFVGDNMSISEPNGVMDRNELLAGDPFKWDIYYDANADALSDVGLSVVRVGQVTDGRIDVECNARFSHNINSHKYHVAYVVTEDGLPAQQSNYFASGAYGTMGGWENLSDRTFVMLNHVARGIWNFDGAVKAFPAQVEKLVDYPFTYSIDLSSTDYMKADKLTVVALVIDGATEQIVQAAKLPVGTTLEGISAPIADADASSQHGRFDAYSYDLAGRRGAAGSAPHGISIVGGAKRFYPQH